MLLEQESVRKVVLINADVLSRKASPKDRNIYPLIGDAAPSPWSSATRKIRSSTPTSRWMARVPSALIIPAGGLRLPSTPETAVLEDVGDNNLRAKDHLFMDGSAIFNFVQTEVPPLIESLLAARGRVDGFGGLFSLPSAEPVHAAKTGGQNEGAPRAKCRTMWWNISATAAERPFRWPSPSISPSESRTAIVWPAWPALAGADLGFDADASGRA